MLCTVSLTSPPVVEQVIQELLAWGNGSYPMDLSSLVVAQISIDVEVPVQSSSIVGLVLWDPLDCTPVRFLMGVALIELCTLEWVQVQTIYIM